MADLADDRAPKTESPDTGPNSHEPRSEHKSETKSETKSEAQPETGSKAQAPSESSAAAEHTAPSCNVGFCPICLAVTAMQPLRPDVIEHLLLAGREFFLAAKAVLDARAEQFTGEGGDGAKRSTRLEKIDIG